MPDVPSLLCSRSRMSAGRLGRAHGAFVVTARGALCFVGTTLPWLDEQIAAVPLVGRRGLKKLLNRPGDLGPEERGAIAAHLADRFPPA